MATKLGFDTNSPDFRGGDRPFEAFRTAITDPAYFQGRQYLLQAVQRSPFRVRIFLGGRRSGKTSILNALHWTLLQAPLEQPNRALPVFFDFQQEQPTTLDRLRYLLLRRLQEALDTQSQSQPHTSLWSTCGSLIRNTVLKPTQGLRRRVSGIQVGGGVIGVELDSSLDQSLSHEQFRQRLLQQLQQAQKYQFTGICFLLDNAEYVVQQNWSNDAWSYFRALKDTDTAINPFVGFCLSGYRNLKDYQQRVGSPLLNIAEIDWIKPWQQVEVEALVQQRMTAEAISLDTADRSAIWRWGGGQPYLTQQVLSALLDARSQGKSQTPDNILRHQVRYHDRDFSAWWDVNRSDYGFSQVEQKVYLTLGTLGTVSLDSMAQACELSWGAVADIVEVLVGTGVVQEVDEEMYSLGSQLFATWVQQECQGG